MRRITSMMKVVVLLLFIFLVPAYGQSQTVSGTVMDGDKQAPLVGATVKIKGTNTATQTNEKGGFTIKATKGQTLTISHIGFETQNIEVTGGRIAVNLKGTAAELDEVVVAMDIKRKPRELGYSVQTVKGNEIQATQRENFLNGLQGRVAGLSITPTNGMAGASSQIILRGFNSLSLSNQPLFVIDGVIADNSTMDETSNGGSQLGLASDRPNRGNDYTNRIADINPSDIESITILKGPEATALYGSQASSGAVVITTKKAHAVGGGKVNVNYDNSFRIQKITRFPEVNNNYSAGGSGLPSTAPSFIYFGPAYTSSTQKFDNVGAFFKTGFTQTHNLSLDFGGKTSSFRVSGSYLKQDGVVPRNTAEKKSFRISNTTRIGKLIELTPSIAYSDFVVDRPLRSGGGYLLDLYAWPVDNDARNYLDANGQRKGAYLTSPTGEGVDNPLFNANFNHSQDKTSRWIATMGVNVNLRSWLTLNGRFGYDTYNTVGYLFYHPESAVLSLSTRGSLDNYWRNYYGYNHTITLTANKKFGDFSTRVMVGNMWQDYKTEMYASYGTGIVDSINATGMYKNGVLVNNGNFGQVVGSFYDSTITSPKSRIRLNRNVYNQPNELINRQMAYFAEVSIGYKNVVFLNYSHRFEGTSVLPSQNRNYNYPAGSISAILTDIFPALKKSGVLNYAKLRASLASTARLPDPYSNQSVFGANYASAAGPAYSYGYFNNNPDLRPERQHTYEVGGEFRMFNNMLSLDAAYYNTLAYDQISVGYRASYGTGFILNTQNAATTRNQGIELSADLTPVRKKDFNWNIRFNFNHMWSQVIDLPASIAYEYYIADTWVYGNARGGLIRGASTGTITGYGYLRNNNGDILINPTTGLPVIDANFRVRGDRTPAFTLGTINTFRYKNWNLSFLWDWKVGGDIYNATEQYLTTIGKSARTADRLVPRVIKGVLQDGMQNTARPTVNTIVVTPYYLNSYYINMPEEEFIQKNVNWFRLRDITLSYMLPQKLVNRVHGLNSLSVFVTGNDLILFTNYRGADPATNGNTALSKGVGGFGFDYGNLPTPIGVNFGLRAGF
ncbi:MAG: SusC/RagA family TonB-linked outer membrane protein [Bacteroidota bacterium]|nr:SusC/RagA family TonB-linked outer membrane protein [Bacteroidota bacterium]